MESPTDVAALWQAAVEDYETITGVQLQNFATVKHIDGILVQVGLNETNFKLHRHGGSKLDKFRTLVQRSLGPIEMLSHVVAHATKATFPPSEALFSAISYLIKTANAVSSDYDKIVEFFDDLDSYLHRLKTLEHNTPQVPELEAALTDVFRSVLVLCGICTKYTQRKRIVKAFRNLVSGEDAELKSAYERFHKTVEREQAVVRYAILSDVQELKIKTGSVHADVRTTLAVAERLDNNLGTVAAGVRHIQTHVEDRETALERKELLAWLSDLEFHDKQRDAFAKHHQSTGEWLLSSEPFQRWLRDEKTTTIWCPGIPGAGKTVML
ncbi:hypothetical protein B0J18DRAFT_275640 [Chaetomium sp. MPI-SDFR-AT-0129]|nr:hypothetical protein B0J18DRAFT_275640 [Chaetomium sp. MPI-SDFR-AT-0129]